MIYLDNQATTPLAPEAREAMMRWLAGPESAGVIGESRPHAAGFANPHSSHSPGRAASAAIEVAREQIASLLPQGGRVIFTGSATEALNLAILGRDYGHIAHSAIEHPAVVEAAKASSAIVHMLPVSAEGLVAADQPIPSGTSLVAVMQVNNEIGTIQPVDALAQAAHAAGALFLCDAVQGAGKLVPPEGADFIALAAHKLYGPKGIGVLWVRNGIALNPLIHGGGQEKGERSGTLSPALCAGFGAAAALAKARMAADNAHIEALWRIARAALSGWTLNGSEDQRWHGNINIRRDDLDVARLMSDLRGIAFSAGSACATGTGHTSPVLRAIGLSDAQAKTSIRLGIGRYTTEVELEDACNRINAAAAMQGV